MKTQIQNLFKKCYSSGSCYQDRLGHGCRSRAYKDIFTACLDNSFRSYIRKSVSDRNQILSLPMQRARSLLGGTTSWHDFALHIISRHCSLGEALHIAKVYLLKWHGEGQLPYATLVRRKLHADFVARNCEKWLSEHFQETDIIKHVVELSKIPERTLKRRFKASTGVTLVEYLQNLRIEEVKPLLESGQSPVEEISVAVSYDDASFFRRLFKRSTGLTPSQYRGHIPTEVRKLSQQLRSEQRALRGAPVVYVIASLPVENVNLCDPGKLS